MNYPRLIVISLLMLTAYSNASAQAKPLEKRTYAAPSAFLSYGSGSIVEASEDPFADAVSAKPATAQDILWAAGVKFPRGASANFDQETSLLTVVNTQENHVIVELAPLLHGSKRLVRIRKRAPEKEWGVVNRC